MKKFLSLCSIAICVTLATPAVSLAQDPGANPDGPQQTNVPFDGGIALIASAVAGYAVKKGRDKRKAAMANKVEK